MTYNVFRGTLNPTQSINPEQLEEENRLRTGQCRFAWKSEERK